MAETKRATISFDEGEHQAVEALLASDETLEVFYDQLGRLRHHVATGGVFWPVGALDVSSFSDAVRALVRIGLDAIDRESMARQYELAAPLMDAILADPGIAGLLAASNRASFDATGHASREAGTPVAAR